jgi:aspartyl protease family protein
LRRPHPATGRIAALAFAVNSPAIDRKIRLALHPTGRRGLTARVLQTFPRFLSLGLCMAVWLGVGVCSPAVHANPLGQATETAVPRQPAVSLMGTVGQRAVLAVGQKPPRTIAVGESLHGVKLLAVEGRQATVQVDGQTQVLHMGQQPLRASLAAPPASTLQLQADERGHFQAQGQINGKDVMFMVDTGASTIALGSAQARQLGIDYLRQGQEVQVSTANGSTRGWVVMLAQVSVGGLVQQRVQAVVTPQPMPYVLLGNSFLHHYQMNRQGQRMTLEAMP